jgi:hypothetical protein
MKLSNFPKVPQGFMPALVALVLIANFTFELIGPSIWASYKPPLASMENTLINLVILAVGFYLGSSSSSARKDELNAAQQDKAITALAPNAPPPTPLADANAPAAPSLSTAERAQP